MSILGKLSKHLFSKGNKNPALNSGVSSGVVKHTGGNSSIVESLLIPEPTKSLLWTTDADTSMIESATSIRVVINQSRFQQQENGFYSEPSLIWTKLPIKPNQELIDEAMYWPSYSAFSPEARYQYLNWLRDITQPTNLSYVFLYFYGLERHLLVGDYDAAVDEIARLLEAHPKKSFIQYASRSLVVASLAKGRLDVVERVPSLLSEEIDETLAIRIIKGTSMTPEDVIEISSRVGFKNKRYINMYPEIFKQELQKQIDLYEDQFGNLLSTFKIDDFKRVQSSAFANLSIPERVRQVKVPVILDDKRFSDGILQMLRSAHDGVKSKLSSGDIDRVPSARPKKTNNHTKTTTPVTKEEVDKLIESLRPSTRRVLDLHFAIQHYIQENYRQRANPVNYREAIIGCVAQISMQDVAAKQFIAEYPEDSLPSHAGYNQFIIILEKEGRFDEAIKAAEKAKREGWNGDWDNKIQRLSRKLNKAKAL